MDTEYPCVINPKMLREKTKMRRKNLKQAHPKYKV